MYWSKLWLFYLSSKYFLVLLCGKLFFELKALWKRWDFYLRWSVLTIMVGEMRGEGQRGGEGLITNVAPENNEFRMNTRGWLARWCWRGMNADLSCILPLTWLCWLSFTMVALLQNARVSTNVKYCEIIWFLLASLAAIYSPAKR